MQLHAQMDEGFRCWCGQSPAPSGQRRSWGRRERGHRQQRPGHRRCEQVARHRRQRMDAVREARVWRW